MIVPEFNSSAKELPRPLAEKCPSIIKKFISAYDAKPDFVARSPGRVNLIGEHISFVFTDIYGNLIDSTTVEENISVSDNPVCFLKNEYNEIIYNATSYLYISAHDSEKLDFYLIRKSIKLKKIKTIRLKLSSKI